MRRALLRLAPVLLPLAALIGPGVSGLDFGRHWDERVHHVRVIHLLRSGVPKAHYYYYPGLCHRVLLMGLAPELVRGVAEGASAESILARLQELVPTTVFQLRARAVFLGVSALSVVWLYVALLVVGGRIGEALLGSLLLATSWEVGYHLRWVAPDGINMQLAALTLLLLLAAEAGPRQLRGGRGVVAAAVPAGLALGCKYQAGLLLLPVSLQAWRLGPGYRPRLLAGVLALAAFAGAFVASTPEILYDRPKLLADIGKQGSLYAEAGVQARGGALWGYRVQRGPRHLAREVEYLALSLPSPFLAGSLGLTALAALGALRLTRGLRGQALVILAFPVVYLSFHATMRLFIVRNVLLLAPFGAFLAARGASWLWTAAPRAGRMALGAGLAAILAANLGFAIWAAGTIRDRHTDRFVRELGTEIAAQPGVRVLASHRVSAELAAAGFGALANLTTDPAATVEQVAFYHREGLDANEWPSGRRLARWIGPHEVNFCYYPSWPGDDRIVVLPIDWAGFGDSGPWPERGRAIVTTEFSGRRGARLARRDDKT